jgi:hypothetical protein
MKVFLNDFSFLFFFLFSFFYATDIFEQKKNEITSFFYMSQIQGEEEIGH